MHVSEPDLELIDAVYGATTGENTINDAVRSYLVLQEDPGAVLFHFDSIMETSSDLEIVSPDDALVQVVQSIFDKYAGASGTIDNPLISAGFHLLVAGEVRAFTDAMSRAELQRTDYYQQVMAPLGVRRSWSGTKPYASGPRCCQRVDQALARCCRPRRSGRTLTTLRAGLAATCIISPGLNGFGRVAALVAGLR